MKKTKKHLCPRCGKKMTKEKIYINWEPCTQYTCECGAYIRESNFDWKKVVLK